jgi:peptidoglycan/xylan/chitin deacetylase (PgdA/CDA1 family)
MTLTSAIKRIVPSVLAHPLVRAPLAPARRGRAAIFMLHRFRDDARGVSGHEPTAVRAVLAYLRRARYPILSLRELFDRLLDGGPPIDGAVAFTIDDGYADHVEIAAPLFAEFECPVTTFVTTGFVDGQVWMWWDRIDYTFTHTTRWHWPSDAERRAAQQAVIDRCKLVSDTDKLAMIQALATEFDVTLPATAPDQYAPMTWDQMRGAEARGMDFAPHTVTHPILSRATDDGARHEIGESWERLRAEARRPVPVFCYPNGQPGDFGPREMTILRETGLRGAVVGWPPGYADVRDVNRSADARWTVHRFADADRVSTVAQCASGLAWLRAR